MYAWLIRRTHLLLCGSFPSGNVSSRHRSLLGWRIAIQPGHLQQAVLRHVLPVEYRRTYVPDLLPSNSCPGLSVSNNCVI